MELYEIEELLKSTDKKALAAVMRSAAILKDKKATPEMRAQALENIKAISGVKLSNKQPKQQKPQQQQGQPQQGQKPQLEDAIASSKEKMDQIHRAKQQEHLTAAQNIKANNKAEVQAERDKLKAEERKKELLPGSEFTLQEIQASAARAERDPNALKDKPLAQRMQTPEMAQKQAVAKRNSTVNTALDLAHQLHGSGDSDSAHQMLNAIPKEHMPPELKHYNPVYIHYGITPNLWKQSPHAHDHAHEFHNQVMSGAHDNHADERTRSMVTKVKNLLKPPVS